MQSAIFDTPVLKVESLKTKFDTIVLSNSFIALLGDCNEARILQELHYWCYSEYGVIIDKVRWIYKPLREWLSEALTGITSWKLRVAIASLLEKGLIYREKLYVKHHELKHDNPYWHPKNQTYYYTVNYDKLQELIEQVENAEVIENVRIEESTKLSVEDFQDTKCCELSQNKTDITSTENNSRDQSHPTLPCVGEEKINQYENTSNASTQPETEKLQETDRPSPKLKAQSVTQGKQKRVLERIQNGGNPQLLRARPQDKAPWKDKTEKSQFYRALVQALPIVANSHSPQGLAKTIMAQVKRGEEHTYWDEFKAGLPIGSSTKPEWEVEPGIPHPMFIEYLVEKLIAGNNSQTREQAIAEINDYLKDPILRAQLMPQLWHSDYELITDELGQIIGVKAPPPAEE